jgi:hypothetical protein
VSAPPRLVYCHCAYAKVVPPEVKSEVLRRLCASGKPFEAVADLCEMSARKDPELRRYADGAPTRIAACFPRAVKWLFHAAQAPLPPQAVEVLNMREKPADEVAARLLEDAP